MKKEPSIQNWLLLSAYLDGELPKNLCETVEERLRMDEILREELESLKHLKTILRHTPRKQIPRNFTLSREMVQPRPMPVLFPIFSAVSVLSTILFAILYITQFLPLLSSSDVRASLSPNMMVESEKLDITMVGEPAARAVYEEEAGTIDEAETTEKTCDDEMPVEEQESGAIVIQGLRPDTEVSEEIVQEEAIEEYAIMEKPAAGAAPENKNLQEPEQAPPPAPEAMILATEEVVDNILPTDTHKEGQADDSSSSSNVIHSTSTNGLKNNFNLTPTGPLQEQNVTASLIQKKQQFLWIEIISAATAIISALAAYLIWKKSH